MSEERLVLVEDAPHGHAGVRLVTLNRADRRNALSVELVMALDDALKEADADRSVRAIVITGAGDKAFCAGGDLGSGPGGDGFLDVHASRGTFAGLLRTMRRLGTPTVAAVNGAALGGGFGIALSCDFAVAHREAKLGTPEVRRGMFPMIISRVVYETLPRRIANELVLLGESVSGERAVEVGVVNKVVDGGEVLTESLALASRLAGLSPAILSLGRRAVARQHDMGFDAALDYLHDQLSFNLMTEDAMEGIAAFLEKRDPQWKGR